MSAASGATSWTSPTRRARRSKADIDTIKSAIFDVAVDDRPVTVRQVFYRLVSAGVIGKTEAEYKGTVCRLLADMRRAGEIPFGWIADNTRWMRKPHTYGGLEQMMEYTALTYRRALWDTQDAYVEVWLEKEALAGVLVDVTDEWDVPLMVTRGYPSLSFLSSAAETIENEDRVVSIYYFGDRDPSGVDIPRFVEKQLIEMTHGIVNIDFTVVAVTPEQVTEYNLPTRPTKRTDSRARNFEGRSVEVDAIPPSELRAIARRCIEQHVDYDELLRIRTIEAAERETLQTIASNMRGAS